MLGKKIEINADDFFATADLHIDHPNIINLNRRPYANVDDMAEGLIKNWNSIVPVTGSVFVAGDLLSSATKLHLLDRLNGKIYWCYGNHDYALMRREKNRQRFTRHGAILEVTVKDGDTEQLIVISHWSMRTWNKRRYGAWHLFAHSHGSLGPLGKSFDIGVDCNNYGPLSYPSIKSIMATRPIWETYENGHHNRK